MQNSAADPLTLANGFIASPSITGNTFAIDPNFRVGYAQNWQASVQRDLPGSLQMTATYLGIKGTRGPQEFLPNTYPIGAANPCPACPTGFAYLTSNGNSTREAAQIQLRRRLHNGFHRDPAIHFLEIHRRRCGAGRPGSQRYRAEQPQRRILRNIGVQHYRSVEPLSGHRAELAGPERRTRAYRLSISAIC